MFFQIEELHCRKERVIVNEVPHFTGKVIKRREGSEVSEIFIKLLFAELVSCGIVTPEMCELKSLRICVQQICSLLKLHIQFIHLEQNHKNWNGFLHLLRIGKKQR